MRPKQDHERGLGLYITALQYERLNQAIDTENFYTKDIVKITKSSKIRTLIEEYNKEWLGEWS